MLALAPRGIRKPRSWAILWHCCHGLPASTSPILGTVAACRYAPGCGRRGNYRPWGRLCIQERSRHLGAGWLRVAWSAQRNGVCGHRRTRGPDVGEDPRYTGRPCLQNTSADSGRSGHRHGTRPWPTMASLCIRHCQPVRVRCRDADIGHGSLAACPIRWFGSGLVRAVSNLGRAIRTRIRRYSKSASVNLDPRLPGPRR